MTGRGRYRTFAAIDPPAVLAAELVAWARDQRAGAQAMRVLAADSLHLTLAFLGERSAAEVERIGESLAIAAGHAGRVHELVVGEPLLLPQRRPRVLAASIDDPGGELADLHHAIAEALSIAVGWAEPRAFRPHVTLARFGRDGRAPRELGPLPAGNFAADEIVLYRSHLEQSGARYEELERIALR